MAPFASVILQNPYIILANPISLYMKNLPIKVAITIVQIIAPGIVLYFSLSYIIPYIILFIPYPRTAPSVLSSISSMSVAL